MRSMNNFFRNNNNIFYLFIKKSWKKIKGPIFRKRNLHSRIQGIKICKIHPGPLSDPVLLTKVLLDHEPNSFTRFRALSDFTFPRAQLALEGLALN